MKKRMTQIIERLNEGIHEREETIAVSFLAALSDQNVFLFGPPGTAKSLIARRLSHAFETNSYFEYLMHRFSTPEEVFGPVSITELKKDNFLRKTEGFLPQSDFAFLDEIWKSSPSILNTLLTIINEKLFRNGTDVEQAPLKALIAASNETPPPKEGLEALYDRFLVRLNVPPIEGTENFERLLNTQPTRAELEHSNGLAIKQAEWEKWRKEIHGVKLSEETLNVIRDIRLSFEEKGEELDVYVSDRRWQKAAILLKAAAFFCGRKETNLVDTLLLRHCLWTTKENCPEVQEIVEDAVRNCGFETGISLRKIDVEKDELEKEIKEELFHSEDVYETENLRGDEYFKCDRSYIDRYRDQQQITFYILASKMKSTDEFHPIDKQGNELDQIMCCFDGQGTCSIEIPEASATYYGQRKIEVKDFSRTLLLQQWRKLLDEQVAQWEIETIQKLRRKLLERLKEWLKKLQLLADTLDELSIEPGLLFDLSKDNLTLSDIEQLKNWISYISKDKGVRELCDLMGRLRRAEQTRRQELVKTVSTVTEYVPDINSREEIVGVYLGKDIEHALPQEIALLSDDDTSVLFDMKFVEGRLMCFEMEGMQTRSYDVEEEHMIEVEEEENLGPIIICVDTSGSMQGSPETIAKAVTLFMATRAISQKRNCYLINFSTRIETLDLSGQMGMAKMMAFLQRSFHGGTDVSPALTQALDMMSNEKYEQSDLLIISDFMMASLPELLYKEISNAKANKNRFYSLAIGDLFLSKRLQEVFDNEWVYNPSNSSISSIQNVVSTVS